MYPSLVLTYAGEAAYLIKHPHDLGDAFYKSTPHSVFWLMFVISTLAAIVASQSLITATFSIIKQSMALGCFPRVKIIHTSNKSEGQIYSPEVNYCMMVLCIAVVLGFQSGTQIGNAFGKYHHAYSSRRMHISSNESNIKMYAHTFRNNHAVSIVRRHALLLKFILMFTNHMQSHAF